MSNQKSTGEGEGNADADRNYRKATEEFVESGKVEKQEEDRKNISDAERAELEKAEEAGKKPARR